jgi:thymidine kinase
MSFMARSRDGTANFTNFIALFIGPMKSGKSLELALFVNKYGRHMNVLVVKPDIDTTSNADEISSRAGLKVQSVSVASLLSLVDHVKFAETQIFVIDECQFFPDLKEFVLKWKHEKSFVLGSLDADDRQQKFGQVWDLIPYARKVKKLTALCEMCNNGNLAVATISIGQKVGQIDVDDRANSKYRSVCEIHIPK